MLRGQQSLSEEEKNICAYIAGVEILSIYIKVLLNE